LPLGVVALRAPLRLPPPKSGGRDDEFRVSGAVAGVVLVAGVDGRGLGGDEAGVGMAGLRGEAGGCLGAAWAGGWVVTVTIPLVT
jgi:hypothetical protein